MQHFTKTKGDNGVAHVIADLSDKGIDIFIPLSEHLPFDLIGLLSNKQLKKISVKYRKIVNGKIDVLFKSVYSDSNGTHVTKVDKSEIDIIAIYCPDTKEVYYINPNDFNESVSLRITIPKNNQIKGINFSKDYKVFK